MKNVPQISMSGNGAVKLVPVLRPRMPPGDFVMLLALKVGIGYAQAMEPLSILFHLAYTLRAKTGGPGVLVGSHSSIEVPEEV